MVLFLSSWSNSKVEVDYSYLRLAKYFSKKGKISSCLFDYRGHGDSPGDLAAVSFKTILEDIEFIVHYVAKKFHGQKLVFFCKGISALFLIRAKLEQQISGAIFIEPVFSLSEPLRLLA